MVAFLASDPVERELAEREEIMPDDRMTEQSPEGKELIGKSTSGYWTANDFRTRLKIFLKSAHSPSGAWVRSATP